ncbi:dethiobiotin synthase [Herbivorax sp. ANBcel31]|uniref:dethiobiotin synthase n=1 Tax=Herbivorax sp. ANBcel31 TaxID=3069754 RepID=UPI0027B77E0D|nr:dethiobiotin synthase [Herbivorax sp. ANBcel31]MDQ2085319.1 dethiobiotin synthase [Herbivorax sp. ANBcel31]
MGKAIFIAGTDTDVGKTFITAGLNYSLNKAGYKCCSFKPVQSGGIESNHSLIPGDIDFIKKITDIDEPYEKMNSYCLKEEVSPHLASELEDIQIDREKIIADFNYLNQKYDYTLVEGAGGLVVPIIRNKYYMYDLIKDLNIPVLLVARAGVGTINHTALTCEFAKLKGIKINGIIINEYKGKLCEKDNIDIITKITGIPVVSVMPFIKTDKISDIKACYEKHIKLRQGDGSLVSLF